MSTEQSRRTEQDKDILGRCFSIFSLLNISCGRRGLSTTTTTKSHLNDQFEPSTDGAAAYLTVKKSTIKLIDVSSRDIVKNLARLRVRQRARATYRLLIGHQWPVGNDAHDGAEDSQFKEKAKLECKECCNRAKKTAKGKER